MIKGNPLTACVAHGADFVKRIIYRELEMDPAMALAATRLTVTAEA
jgi:hypothetical protein